MNLERTRLLNHEINSGLSVLLATLCIIDVFGVFPIIALPRAIVQCGKFNLLAITIIIIFFAALFIFDTVGLLKIMTYYFRIVGYTPCDCGDFFANLFCCFIGKIMDYCDCIGSTNIQEKSV